MKSFTEISKKVLLAVGLICILLASSCKSHKKVTEKNDAIIMESMIRYPGKDLGKRIAEESITWIGTPYGYGCSEKGVATDCSGLVLMVYKEIAEVKLPRNSAQQAEFCNNLKEKEVHPGDLVFFATGKDKEKISHVGVMIDSESFVHASSSKGVILSEIKTPYYQRTFIKFGRVPTDLELADEFPEDEPDEPEIEDVELVVCNQ